MGLEKVSSKAIVLFSTGEESFQTKLLYPSSYHPVFDFYTFIYKNTKKGSFWKNFNNNPISAEEQSLKFSIQEHICSYSSVQYSSKCRVICKLHYASWLFTYSGVSQLRKAQTKTS